MDGVFGQVQAAGTEAITEAGGMVATLLAAGLGLRMAAKWAKRAVGMS